MEQLSLFDLKLTVDNTELKDLHVTTLPTKPAKLEDFGSKIGGARKDLWKDRGLSLEDLYGFNRAEMKKLVTKDAVWPKLNYRQMVDDGTEKLAAYYIKYVRDAIPTKPLDCGGKTLEESVQDYVSIVSFMRQTLEACTQSDHIKKTQSALRNHVIIPSESRWATLNEKGRSVVNDNLWQHINISVASLSFKMAKAKFLEDKESSGTTATSKRKTKMKISPLDNVHSDGFNYRNGNDATQEDILDLGFRAGEYGNWLDQHDRQQNLNHCYDSIRNMAIALDVPETAIANPKGLGFDHEALAIAFGSRGRAGAAAHYEPMRHVINLTKMHGAGSLAHELGHSIDRVCEWFGEGTGWLATDNPGSELKALIHTLQYKELDAGETMRYYAKRVDAACEEMRNELRFDTRRWIQEGVDSTKIDAAIEICISEALGDENYHLYNNGEIDRRGYCGYEALNSIRPNNAYVSPTMINSLRDVIAKEVREYQNACHNPGAMKVIDKTEFLKTAEALDMLYSKDAFGYWSSSAEMFARAFACYIEDKLKSKGITDDYLTGHADALVFCGGDVGWSSVGTLGKERQLIDAAFDNYFDHLKENRFFE